MCYTTRRRASQVVIGLWALVLMGDAQDAQLANNRSDVVLIQSAIQGAKTLLREIDHSILRLGKPAARALARVGRVGFFSSYPRLGVVSASGSSEPGTASDGDGESREESAPAPPPPTSDVSPGSRPTAHTTRRRGPGGGAASDAGGASAARRPAGSRVESG